MKLNKHQLNRLSEFTSNLALLFFGSIALPVLAGIDKFSSERALLGAGTAVIFVIMSLLLIKKK